ncbi:phage portal protein, partial [Chengkuizengella sp. YPA3-1-1]|nr:phage portal protein [Chengkuizengella marina]
MKGFLNKNNKYIQQAKLLNGYTPIFSQFGTDIYASDVVQSAIDCIATECSKLQPKHIRMDGNDMQTIVKGSINRLFKFSPNELMTTRDFIEKVIWLLYMNYNAFIYPTYDLVTSNGVTDPTRTQ